MKITDKSNKFIDFNNIDVGEFFRQENLIYLKVDTIDDLNSFDFESNVLVEMSGDCELIRAELVITG